MLLAVEAAAGRAMPANCRSAFTPGLFPPTTTCSGNDGGAGPKGKRGRVSTRVADDASSLPVDAEARGAAAAPAPAPEGAGVFQEQPDGADQEGAPEILSDILEHLRDQGRR